MRPGGRATIKDVASRAGVSSATVSNVLLGRQAATREVADRVRSAVQSLDYVADRSASQLRSGKTRIIAVLVPSLTDPFFAAVIADLERQAQAERYDIIVASSNNDDDIERARLAALLSWRPSGLVIVPNSDGFPNRTMLDGIGLPHIVIDRVPSNLASDSVAAANQASTAEASAHLLDHGHRDILVVASTLRIHNIRQRCKGIAQSFAERGLPPPPTLEVGLTFETVADRLASWLSSNARPTAFLTVTNFATMGVLSHLLQAGLRLPHDVSLIGFDDYEWMRAAAPTVTAIRQDVASLASKAWAVLTRRIAGDVSPAQHHTVPCQLIVRDSVRRVGFPLHRPPVTRESGLRRKS